MKKITLIIMILGVLIIANAQIDKKQILERLKVELLPQTEDYNPYQYARENFIISCLEVRIEFERDDCENVKEIIEKFHEIDTMEQDKEKIEHIRYISRFQCQETYSFLKTQIKNNPSETVRCNAIIFLAWSLNSDYLLCILEYAKKDSLSIEEKAAIAAAFTNFGTYTSHLHLKEEAAKLLDEICYDFSSDTITGFDPCNTPPAKELDQPAGGVELWNGVGGQTPGTWAHGLLLSLRQTRRSFFRTALVSKARVERSCPAMASK